MMIHSFMSSKKNSIYNTWYRYYYEHNFPILEESLKGRKARDLSHPSTGLLGSVKEMFYERFKRGDITNSLLDQIIPNRLI